MRNKWDIALLLGLSGIILFLANCDKALVLLEELKPAQVIVVLGKCPPVDKTGKPNPELLCRVMKGVELFKSGMAPFMIMTGGNTYKDYYESAVMKEFAVSLGVPREAIIEECEAVATVSNARYTARIMNQHGWNSCIIVSSSYHLKRAKKLFEAHGLTVQIVACEVP